MSLVGSSCLASSHMLCTHACEVRFASLGLSRILASSDPIAARASALTGSICAGSLPDTAEEETVNASSQPRSRFGRGLENSSTNSTCPPKPHVSLNKHQAKIDG